MFERFTDQARRVGTLAQEKARMLRHNRIGTQHLLLRPLQRDDAPAAAPHGGPAEAGDRGLLSEAIARFESMDSRLSAVEQRVGTGPDVGDLDQQIAQARREKDSAARAEDYETAAALRDRERQLLAEKASRQQEGATAQLDLPSLAEGLQRLSGEVDRLRRLLRQQGIDPKDGAA